VQSLISLAAWYISALFFAVFGIKFYNIVALALIFGINLALEALLLASTIRCRKWRFANHHAFNTFVVLSTIWPCYISIELCKSFKNLLNQKNTVA